LVVGFLLISSKREKEKTSKKIYEDSFESEGWKGRVGVFV